MKQPNNTSTESSSLKPYDLSPVPQGARQGWELTVNGETVPGVSEAKLINSSIGISVEYGLRPEGYDGFIIRERGGAVTLPYMIDPDGQIYVGLVSEYRPTMGEERTLNAPRGMAEAGESHDDTAVRELGEETGYQAKKTRMAELATGLNLNSTFFDNSRAEQAGVSIYAFRVDTDELELGYDNEGNVFYQFPSDTMASAQNKTTEAIFGSKFVPIMTARGSKDMLTRTACGDLLLSQLEGGNYIVPQHSTFPESSRVPVGRPE